MVGRGWVSWLLASVVASLLVTSCGEDTKNGNKPSTTPTDGGSDNAAGMTSADGGDPAANAGGSGSSGAPSQALGLHCKKDADCGTGLTCLGADQDYPGGTGAPPNGLCTRDCDTDKDCRGFDPTAVCGTLDESPVMLGGANEPARRLCLQGCEFGAPSGAAKCRGQRDLACRPFAPAPVVSCFQPDDVCPDGTFCFRGACREAACGPRCNTNADCAQGRSCNADTGLCDEGTQPAVPVGAACPGDEDPNSTVCGNGTCLLLSSDGANVKRMCSQTCTIGTLCGDNGACVLPRLDPYAAGDIGYCMQRCNCDADCLHPDDKCYEWETPVLAQLFQSRGICDTADPAFETLTSCEGEGGAGGAGGTGNEPVGGDTSAGSGGQTDVGGQGGQKN